MSYALDSAGSMEVFKKPLHLHKKSEMVGAILNIFNLDS